MDYGRYRLSVPYGVRPGHARCARPTRCTTEIGDWRLEIRPHLSTPVKEGWWIGGYPLPRPSINRAPCGVTSDSVANLPNSWGKRDWKREELRIFGKRPIWAENDFWEFCNLLGRKSKAGDTHLVSLWKLYLRGDSSSPSCACFSTFPTGSSFD